jgi:beta-phosphoglucomutase
MPLHAEAFRRALAPFEIEVTDRRIFELEGAPTHEVLEALLRDQTPPVEISALAQIKDDWFRRLGPPPWTPGATDLLIGVKVPMAVVSGSSRYSCIQMLGLWSSRFAAIVAAGDTEWSKPHAEPYQAAAEALGLAPESCIAVENAPLGIRSARDAGYAQVLGFASTFEPQELDADVTFASMQDLGRYLRTALGMPVAGVRGFTPSS